MNRITHSEVLHEANRRGWELDETYRGGEWVLRWFRGHQSEGNFATEAAALDWMEHWLTDRGHRPD